MQQQVRAGEGPKPADYLLVSNKLRPDPRGSNATSLGFDCGRNRAL
jgi:hypothetical protein